MLSLVLLQSRSYRDIGSLLRLGESDVRGRAHAAAGQLAPAEGAPGAQTRARIIDYMLGEQTVSARAQTRSELESSEVARKWAAKLAEGLAPLAKSPLPSIPDPPAPTTPAPTTPTPTRTAPTPTPAAPAAEPRKAAIPPRSAAKPASAPPQPPRRPPAAPQKPPARLPPRTPPPPRQPRGGELPRERLDLAGAVALIAIIALVIVLVSTGGGSSHRKTSVSTVVSTTSTATGTRTVAHPARTIEKLVLKPAGSNGSALGAGAVIRQKDGTLLLLVQARGLVPNSPHNAYAVWLVNSPGNANLLGFVKPAVGASGRFSSGAQLPSDASRFHSLVVTIERSSQPTSPGPAVLRSPLSLP